MNEETTSSNKIYGFTTNDLKKWALEYDSDNGSWPESQYEGCNFYDFVILKLDENYIPYDAQYADDEGTEKWEQEVESFEKLNV